ncbi:MAG: glycoside hydrolase family 9 protein, partial [Ignavibacteriaceae bacterium]|nr:glycoside hydrolase family 9 protein [Ignavibacteriaceae bacterium]
AKHYQWYPFINLGHFVLAQICDDKNRHDFIEFLQEGIEKVYLKSKDNPFLFGVPFIWCSNNLVAAMLTQCHLYKNLTGDTTYEEMELSLRDWLFGCNPWGTSMVIGLPEYGDYPVDPHSAFTHLKNIAINGGLVDGPVYTSIYQKLLGIKLYAEDEYKIFQSNIAVYHDDYGDYSTNEPTMDGTASLTYYLSAMQRISSTIGNKNKYEIRHGAVVRTDKSKKQINLVFTGHDFGDGLEVVYKTLKKHEVHASFFFTGDFYRNKKFTNQIQNLVKDGHYLGAHSNKHLLFASWTNRDSTLLTKKDFFEDIKLNYQEMKNFNINPRNSKIFLPAFEWYNNEISMWCKELGLVLVCHSSGTDSNQDWTYPELGIKYVNNTEIFESILAYESSQPDGLNGFILLLHVGADDKRPEKFYNKLDELITQLKKRGYVFTLLSETI